MTALLAPPPGSQLWSSMPGWGIAADLTPRELIEERHLRVLRKLIAAGLALVVVLCTGGYVLAVKKYSSATGTRDAITTRSQQLQQQLHSKSFRNVVRVQGTLTKVQSQVSALMKDDVDLPALLTKLRTALPASMAINSLSVTLTPGGAAAVSAAGTGLDTSGQVAIGTVTVSGSGRTLDDLPTYVDRLAKVGGVVNLVPTSNQTGKGGAQFSLSFTVTDKLYSHRYDVANTGGK
jgi:hypothetical protein